jgi:hypothetical protein
MFKTYKDDQEAKSDNPDNNECNASVYYSLPEFGNSKTEIEEEDGNLHQGRRERKQNLRDPYTQKERA